MFDRAFEKLERIVVFRFQLFGQEVNISDTLFVTWLVIAFLIVFTFFATRKLSVDKPNRFQVLLEWLVSSIDGMCQSSIGEHGRKFLPYLGSLILFLGVGNIIAAFNFIPGLELYPPAKDINTTAPLALMSMIVVLYSSFRYKGVKGWLKSFVDPMAMMAPFKLMEYATKPLSLCLRLFGNVLAGFLIMEIILSLAPLAAAPFSAYFDIADGILQAFIFVYLTSLYIGEAVE